MIMIYNSRRGCVDKTVKSLDNACNTQALLQWGSFTKGHYIKCITFTFTFKWQDLLTYQLQAFITSILVLNNDPWQIHICKNIHHNQTWQSAKNWKQINVWKQKKPPGIPLGQCPGHLTQRCRSLGSSTEPGGQRGTQSPSGSVLNIGGALPRTGAYAQHSWAEIHLRSRSCHNQIIKVSILPSYFSF